MCTNYAPVQRLVLRDIFGVEPPAAEWKPETWPDYAAPIVRMDGNGRRDSMLATFGLVPRSRIPQGVRPFDTMNARSETVGEKRSFTGPWKKGQLCLIPATAVYEPNYEAGPKSTRYRIWLTGEPAFGIAGLWKDWPDGSYSFTMLTVNADKHPLMSRMHAPGKEKRSVVIVPQPQWTEWLACRDPEVARSFMTLYPHDRMGTEPAPVARRTKEPPPNADAELPL